jgi:uncharacterized protein (TIGR03083 family)
VTDVRTTYSEAAGFLVDTARRVEPGDWARPGLGVWSVRELVGHASRALVTVPTYLARPPERVDLPTPVDYYLRTSALASAPEVAERGRQAAEALGDEPAATLARFMGQAVMAVGDAPGGALVGTPWGGMRLPDYLRTRIFELTVHTLDLAAALGLEARPPEPAAQVSMALAAELAVRTGQAGPLLLAVTGRGPLPDGFTVL